MKSFFKYFSFVIKLFVFLIISIGVFAANETGDDDMFTREKILEILSRETILYYSDGEQQLGSLFSNEHRLYITIDRVPQVMKDAIISAEDESFYNNMGIDVKGIVRAAVNNFLYGTRQGASTITQQTVKNLYGRSKTNLATKFQEMLSAFKLEKRFSKDEILEFYLNQFHVTGNGRGVGIAAKYYFNKEVEELNLVEAAFIAGSVKGPDKYNPYTKSTIEKQTLARENAFYRKNYVLERMLKTGKISEAEYAVAQKKEIPFNQGKFQFNEIAISQIVRRQLARPEILRALDVESLDEIANKGYHITTTLEQPIQKAAQYGLKQNLSRIQMSLNDFEFDSSKNYQHVQKPELYTFYTGKVIEVDPSYRAESIKVSLGAQSCKVDTAAINRVAVTLDQVNQLGIERAKSKLMERIQPDHYVLVSIKDTSPNGDLLCDIETRPTVQGGAIAIDKGQIVALVGGFSTNEYNRAIFAQRQPGSTFKAPVFYAGMQLGWTALDPISNMRDVFVWQNQFYYPRPDHRPKTLETTLVGAGVKSENLASVWLLRHLTDRLTYAQYEDLLKFLKILTPGDQLGATLQNISNKFNASSNDESNIKQGILDKIKNDLLSDVDVMKDPNLKIFAYTLHYGKGFENQARIVEKTYKAIGPQTKYEKEVRLNSLKNNMLRWNRVRSDLRKIVENLKNSDRSMMQSNGSFALSKDRSALFYISDDSWKPEFASRLVEPPARQYLSLDQVQSLFHSRPELFEDDNLYLDGVVPLSMLDGIALEMNERYQEIQNLPPLEKLYWNADFRYSLGLYYTASMLNGMGVQTPFDWVPSLPLGSNAISLAELAMIYQTFLTGKTYKFYDDDAENQLAIIKRIEDSRGNLLWEYRSKEFQYIDKEYSTPILNVLRSVVTAGTGYSLNWDVVLRSNDPIKDRQLQNLKIRVPNFGKTGTTNDFTSGTYVGFLPYPSESGMPLSADNAITIATYVGNDDNKPMQRGSFKVYGGGAIPAWKEIALSIIKNKQYVEKLNWNTERVLTEHVLPFDYGYHSVNLVVPVNSSMNMSNFNGLDDDREFVQRNLYSNDYSDNGQSFLKLSLTGDLSDNIFIPKRKVSFYRDSHQTLLEATRKQTFFSNDLPAEYED